MAEATYRNDDHGRRVIDVAELPVSVFGPRSPVWWGNTLMMCIESTTLVLLIASYFYLRQNFSEWPPPSIHGDVPLYRPLPDLPTPSVETVLALLSCGVAFWASRSARSLRPTATKIGLWILFVIALVLIAMRFKDFKGLGVRWDENAYASIVWTLLGTHLTYILAGGAECLIMVLYMHLHPIDAHQAHDVELTCIYWYWVVATWVIVYGVVYFGARWL